MTQTGSSLRWARRLLLGSAGFAALAAGPAAVALPLTPQVVASLSGSGATFSTGPGSLTINQTDPRVVIDWASFNIGAGETVRFVQPNASSIAFNRIASPTTILGALSATGGLWLFSPGGLLFGSGSVVNVGSFVGSTGTLSNPNAALTATSFDLDYAGSSAALTAQQGATLNATAGFVTLQAETIAQSGTVRASDAVSYQASAKGAVTFTETAGGPQLKYSDPASQPGTGRPGLAHSGSTTAGSFVAITAPGGNQAPGFAGVINLSGVIQASGVEPGGSRGVIIVAGTDKERTASGYTGSSMSLDASGAIIRAAADAYVTGESVKLGQVSARNVTALAYRDITATAPITSSEILFQSQVGAIVANADMQSASDILFSADSIRVGPNVTLRSATSNASGVLFLGASGDISADGTSRLISGLDGAPVGLVLVSAGSSSFAFRPSRGGNATLGTVIGKSASLTAAVTNGAGGDLTLLGDLRVTPDASAAPAWPVWSTSQAVTLSGAHIDIQGIVSAGAGDILVRSLASSGPAVIGDGVATAGRFSFSNSQFQRLSGGAIAFEAGGADGAGAGMDLLVGNLTLQADHLSSLWMGTASTQRLVVLGSVLPSSAAAVDVYLGFVGKPSGGVVAGYLPGEIAISGALGSVQAGLRAVGLIARGDILMGSDAYLTAARVNSGFDPEAITYALPADGAGHMFVRAQTLQFTAAGRVVQQNTGAAGTFAGIDAGSPSVRSPLLVRPNGLQGVKVGSNSGWSPDFAQGPTRISLAGQFRSPEGNLQQGNAASYAAAIGQVVPLSANFRMNGCAFSCGGSAPAIYAAPATTVTSTPAAAPDPSPPAEAAKSDDSGGGKTTQAAAAPKPGHNTVFPVREAEAAGAKGGNPDQITGSGNRDLWMGFVPPVQP